MRVTIPLLLVIYIEGIPEAAHKLDTIIYLQAPTGKKRKVLRRDEELLYYCILI